MTNQSKRMLACVITAATLVTSPGCDIKNPASVTATSSDPTLLIRGARSKFSDAMGIIGAAFVASDEGLAKTSFTFEDQSGDISTQPAYTTWYSQVHQARILSADAVKRSGELGTTELGNLAHVWHGWTLIRLAELWGPQPFDGRPDTVTVATMFADALADLDAAKGATADSTRLRAYAGLARVNWIQGRAPVDQTKLRAAIDAAQKVLTEKPTFVWFEAPNSNPLDFALGRSYGPNPFYHDIPLWFGSFTALAGNDPTLIYNDPIKPKGVVMISADELRLIIAESQLLLNDMAAAKAAVKAAPLLPINHVRVCGKAPAAAALTAQQISDCIDPMTAAQLLVVIQDLRREDQYLSARRPVTDAGAAIMPFKLPKNA